VAGIPAAEARTLVDRGFTTLAPAKRPTSAGRRRRPWARRTAQRLVRRTSNRPNRIDGMARELGIEIAFALQVERNPGSDRG